jgi:hypothetical protein
MACRPSAACLHLAAKQFQQAAQDHLVHGVVVHRQDVAHGVAVVRHRMGLARQRCRQARIDMPGKRLDLRPAQGQHADIHRCRAPGLQGWRAVEHGQNQPGRRRELREPLQVRQRRLRRLDHHQQHRLAGWRARIVAISATRSCCSTFTVFLLDRLGGLVSHADRIANAAAANQATRAG